MMLPDFLFATATFLALALEIGLKVVCHSTANSPKSIHMIGGYSI
jgi:hypothetical protein